MYPMAMPIGNNIDYYRAACCGRVIHYFEKSKQIYKQFSFSKYNHLPYHTNLLALHCQQQFEKWEEKKASSDGHRDVTKLHCGSK